MSKKQLLNLEIMSLKELDIVFCSVVLKQDINLIELSKYQVSNGSKEGWKVLRQHLINCHQILTTKTQFRVNNEVKEKYFVAFVLAGNDEATIASGDTQAQATVKALILAHSGQYMTSQQLKELRLAIRKRNGRPLTQAEFGAKTGRHTQQSQYAYEIGKRPVPRSLAAEAFQLFQKSISSVNTTR